MSAIMEQFRLDFKTRADSKAVVYCGNARFSILADRLIRMEYHPQAIFEDRATQTMWYREQAVPDFTVKETEAGIEIETEFLQLSYTNIGDGFTADNLSIRLKNSDTIWHYGDTDSANLKGTTRTVDVAHGFVPLDDGLLSRNGWSVLDDSTSLVFDENSWLESRDTGAIDLYFFGYGHDYKACLQDYCKISGNVPLIPRWILGNWWSRYWHYTQEELTQLINDFEAHQLPFSVCVIDMDWHITKTGNTSSGWTGYTWNRELFPDPQAFIDFLHEKGLHTSMNLHPAEGIHPHEAQYELMAERLGIDPTSQKPIEFDITNPEFARAYFEVLHHPYEDMGIDFWWIDWQQGLKSKMQGLDPLWLINHLHFFDLGRDGTRRPFIFSRWGNQGHQRYPIGFSGDSYVSWESLRFQSYMTPTASNIAYGWWSHDIGGHTSGDNDSELFVRWVQFGVFSPILRIHVTKGQFHDRRNWLFGDTLEGHVLRDALQLRHALIPYLYTMAQRAHEASLPPLLPMYYEYPELDEAYHCPHQYMFGTELIAAPYVYRADSDTGLSRQVVWLPEGDWYHFFTGEYYQGNCWYAIYGELEDMPVFARAGAIIPLDSHLGRSSTSNPDALDIQLFAGADGQFTLYEDDGESLDYIRGASCTTSMKQSWSDSQLSFTIEPAQGDTSLIPQERTISLSIHGVKNSSTIDIKIDGQVIESNSDYDVDKEILFIKGIQLNTASTFSLTLKAQASHRDRSRETIMRYLTAFRLHIGVRNRLADELDDVMDDIEKLAPFILPMTNSQARALFETLCGAGIHQIDDAHDPTLLIMWNNEEKQDISFRYADTYLYFGFMPSAHHDKGIVPRYATITPEIKTWKHSALEKQVQQTQWQLQIDYKNLLSVQVAHLEKTP